MQWLARVCVKRPVFASVIILVLVVFGLFGYGKLGVDYFPKVDIPVITVTTVMVGASPTEVESQITDKIEGAVNTISGIDELRSVSAEGYSGVFVRFVLEKDIDVAAQEVRDKVNSVLRDLPGGVDPPTVGKVDPDATPIMQLALETDRSVKEATELADTVLRRQLESLSGVGQVTLLGGQKRQFNVWIDPVRLRALGITAPEVAQALSLQNAQIPGGTLDTGTRALNLRVVGRVASADELARIVIRKAEGSLVRISDVARVEDGQKELESSARLNGKAAVMLSIRKQSGANTVATVDAITQRLEGLRKSLPDGYTLTTVRDNSLGVRTATGSVKEHLILGAFFAAIVVMVFLGNGRATLVSSLAIPTSIIATFGVMWLQDFSLNIITLMALALVVGIVIDDAIIVIENIYKHVEEHGEPPERAAVIGTREIGMAVLATTLSLIAVFAPVGLMSGIVGRFIKGFGLTMVFAIAVSLLVSFTLVPALSARVFKGGGHFKWEAKLEGLVGVFYHPLERLYMRLLAWSMAHRRTVMLIVGATLLCVVPLLKVVNTEFTPPTEDAEFEVSLRAPEGTNLAQTDLAAERVARTIRDLPGVQATLVTVADDEQKTTNLGRVYVKLTDPSTRKASQAELMDRVRREVVPTVPAGFRATVYDVAKISGGGSSSAKIAYTLTGPDLEVLTRVSQEVLEEYRKVPGVVDADTSLILGKPELVAQVDRDKAGLLGVTMADASTALRMMVGGVEVSTLEQMGEQYDVHLRADGAFRDSQEALTLYNLPSRSQGSVSLGDVVKVEPGSGPSMIKRLSRSREVTLTSNVAPGFGEGAAFAALEQIVKSKHLPPGYGGQAAGMSWESKQMGAAFLVTFLMAFVFVYLILAAQFESWLFPLIILATFPMTLPFSLLSLVVFGQALNLFSILGLLVLFGVVMKNAILQIDHTNQLRAEGMPRLEAILQANKDRLRPILMTTAAFVAGMIPLVLAKGIGAANSQATAGVIVGGQILSLLLTLLAIPVLYSLVDDASAWLKRRFARKAPEGWPAS